ncbi:type I restriction enzyme S subunit [Gordonia amarae]|uniref:Type I restriction-modification system specificity subunit n=2 Tax=Gordonia amarae TaxID=36821 RepID=G7GLJ6_9ACTN|nr:restriction endonuclease subunit S [Gordonia amarae]MCS3876598.1 type I restriction enzyme S subunit [Gordonia amarae]GAB04471.1 type I restriction-modification system specificity subunit [Gordonia amarae NBRC 15530]
MGNELTLAEVCDEIVDCVNRTAPEDLDGEYFAVGTPAMRGNVVNLSEARTITKETFVKWTRRLVPEPGDLLLAREAPVGPVIRIPEGGRYAAGQRTTHLRANPNVVHPRYLYYLLISPAVQLRIQAGAMGSTVPHLRVADVKSLRLPALPPLPTQHAIAEVLGAFDDKIAANEQVVIAGEDLMRSLVAVVATSVPVRELATHVTKSVDPTDFDKVVHFSLPAYDSEQDPVIEPGAAIKSNKFLIEQPCVLFSKLNPRFPRIWDVGNLPDLPPVASTEFIVLVPRSVSRSALWAALAQPEVSTTLVSYAVGTSGSHQRIRPAELLELAIRDVRDLPSSSRSLLDSAGSQVDATRRQSRALADARDELLPLLLSGRVSIGDLENVAASSIRS